MQRVCRCDTIGPVLPLSLIASLLLTMLLPAQAAESDYFIYRDHPRLLLSARRAKLLERERERQTMRWMQFEALMAGQARMPEPGFARALRYVATGERAHGRDAIEWALKESRDLRQTALVFDWCQELVTAAESTQLQAKLQRGLEELRDKQDLASIRSRVFAAVALTGHLKGPAEGELERIMTVWWREKTLPGLRDGHEVIPENRAI